MKTIKSIIGGAALLLATGTAVFAARTDFGGADASSLCGPARSTCASCAHSRIDA